MHKASLTKLDQQAVISLTSYLDFQDVFSLAISSKCFDYLLNNNGVWKFQLSNYFPLDLLYVDEDFMSKSPKEQFLTAIQKYLEIRTYLANIIQKVEPDLQAKKILKNKFLNDFKTKKDIDDTITQFYQKIPLEYYILFRLLNGQTQLEGKFKDDVSLLGGFYYYNFVHEFFLLPLAKPENFNFLSKYKLHTLTKCPRSGARLFVDFHNVLKQGHGAIITLRDQRKEYGKTFLRIIVFKPNLMKFLQGLQYSQYLPEEEILDHFDSFHRPHSDVTTNGIRIRTSTLLDPWDRQYGGNLFAYQIRVSPNGVQGKWTLTTRHWIINDNGAPHEVKGPGVIGLYPQVYEGCGEFTYQSCTPMNGFNGSMKGELYFKNEETGQEIPVTVGEIKMDLPKGSSMLDFCVEDEKTQIVHSNPLNCDKWMIS